MSSENIRLKMNKFKEILDRVKNSNVPTSDTINSSALVNATMPTPSLIKISTITYCVNFNFTSFLNVISRYIPIGNNEDAQNHVGQIIYVKNIYSLPRGQSDKKIKVKRSKKPKDKNTKFPNQVTLNFKYCGSRNVSLMLFGNGAIKMAGILSEKEGIWITHRIIEILTSIKIKIYNIQELPMNSNINDFQLVQDASGIIKAYRWLKINDVTKWYAMDTLTADDVKLLTAGQLANDIWHQIDVNFAKLCNVNKVKDLLVNGIITLKDLVNVDLTKIVPLVPNGGDVNDIKLLKSSICMINSDFNFFFHMKSDVLYKLLSQQYKLDSTYGTHGYQAVKCQYKYNPNNLTSPYPGVCKCPTQCKTRDAICKNITISVFQNGNTIITGATSVEQLTAAHAFIVKVMTDNFKVLFRTAPTNYKKTSSGRTNMKNKKRQIFVLEKAQIRNVSSIK